MKPSFVRPILAAVLSLSLIASNCNAAPGDVDRSFDAGSSIDGDVWAVALQSDGRVLFAGDFRTAHGLVQSATARLNSDGSTDSTFASHISGRPYSMALQSDGKVVLGGSFTSI